MDDRWLYGRHSDKAAVAYKVNDEFGGLKYGDGNSGIDRIDPRMGAFEDIVDGGAAGAGKGCRCGSKQKA